MTTAGVAAAAQALPPASAVEVAPGILAGLILAALVAYSLFLALAPQARLYRRDFAAVALFLLALFVCEAIALLFSPGFHVDIATYEAWGLRLVRGGPAGMYRTGYFLDYPPGYLYALWAAAGLAQALGSTGEVLRMLIGLPALLANIGLGALSYALVRRSAGRIAAWCALLLVALNPALIFDTVVWVQTDSAFTLVMLLSVAMMLDEELELGWALAALAVLIKPQALSLLPVLAVWTLLRSKPARWWRAALAGAAVTVVCVAPFQVGHRWDWLPQLYLATAGYYHETSVNAFNFMALVGGVRVSDSGRLLGLSYFWLGMAMLAPLYAFAIWLVWRTPRPRNLWFASLIVLFGFFMFAPRMHERYLYPAVVFAIPLALQEPVLLAVFALLSFTCFCNLSAALQTLNAATFMAPRATFAMAISLVNLFTFLLAAAYGYVSCDAAEGSEGAGVLSWGWLATVFSGWWAVPGPVAERNEDVAPVPWTKLDTWLLLALVAGAAALRFWHLGHPAEIVFDEVHFVGQARHYLHGEPFLDPHPPLAKLLIAAGILLFGDHPWSWRLGNALLGTLMVAATYPLGRRMFHSRLAGTLAAALIGCDGFFIVDSRIACIDIVYLTFAAIAYLLLFRFVETRELSGRRRLLWPIGIVLGLCLGSKLYVPGITFLLVSGFLLYTLWRRQQTPESEAEPANGFRRLRGQWMLGAALMVGSLSAIFYLGSFLPHYALGWWGGIADLFHYYKQVMWYEHSVASATHPYASPWWSWPLMLRPVAYWQNFPAHGAVATIWGAGNPLTWWAIIPAMTITAVRAIERPNLSRAFLLIGFLAYFVIWIPITRILFLYHYMPSAYIGYLALAAVLADLWQGDAELWESSALLLTIFPAILLGLGHMAVVYHWLSGAMQLVAGLPLVLALAAGYGLVARSQRRAGRFVFIVFVGLAIVLFIYYLPVWLGLPISRNGYYARMWLEGPGLRNWI